MRRVLREEILDYQTYGEKREEIRRVVMEAKARRRVHLDEHLTFLFENTDTIRYQVQEMMRVERIVKEADVRHELDTYNGLLGGEGELGCTLLIEIEDEIERDQKLRQWLDLPQHLYLLLEGGEKVRAQIDEHQVGEDRLSSVQYLRFDTKGQVPVGIGSDLEVLGVEARLSDEQREALGEDLR